MSNHSDNHGISTGKYIAGFVLALILTLFSFIPVMYNLLDGWTVSAKIIYFIGFGLLQMIVQIVYFLHLNHGPDAKWNIGTMCFAAMCVLIIIGGTWWAIQHLNYNMMGGSGRIIIPALIEESQNGKDLSHANVSTSHDTGTSSTFNDEDSEGYSFEMETDVDPAQKMIIEKDQVIEDIPSASEEKANAE